MKNQLNERKNRIEWIGRPYVWELYDTVNDPTESHNVAAQFPQKLRELQRLWIEEAMKFAVFPLNDNLAERLKQAYVHFAPRGNNFTYWTPGAVRINEPLSAAQLGKTHNHSITAYINEVTPATEGIVVAVGGMTGGYALYIKDGKATWTYNFLGMNRTTIATPEPLPAAGADGGGGGGPLELKLDVILVASNASLTGVSADVSLSVNGAVVASETVPQWTQAAFSMEVESFIEFNSIQFNSFVPSFLRSFVPSFLRSFVHSFVRSVISSFVHSFTQVFEALLYDFRGMYVVYAVIKWWW